MKCWSTCALFFFLFHFAVAQEKDAYVVLVSFDGFRSDYVERFDLPNFRAFREQGAAAEGLIPCFPSKTFPNHYSIVTGLYPGHHGLVDNHFYDPETESLYTMRDREAVTDERYYGGTPLWQLARQQGLQAASYFWVGSEVKNEKFRPQKYFPYDQTVPFGDRISTVIGWLRLPEPERPRFVSLYFSSPDSESHWFGPFAPETEEKVMQMDSLLGVLVRGIKETKLPVNVILVSDHGMSALIERPETFIQVEELVPPGDDVISVNGGTQVHVYTRTPSQRDSLYRVLSARADDFAVYTRETFPDRWHYDHRRAGDLLLVARPGKYFVTGDRKDTHSATEEGKIFGAHGYDPAKVADMDGIFYAMGPNIKKGKTLPRFANIHVYPLIARILGLKYGPIDGDPGVLRDVYQH